MTYLKAVFWDYQQFADRENLTKFLQENKNPGVYLWILKRFLEYGRVIDTISFFKITEIGDALSKLNLSPYARKKWKRIIEVYGKTGGE